MDDHNRASQVCIQNLLDILIIQFLCRAEQPVTCIVYYNINLSVFLEHLRNEAVDTLQIRHVEDLAVKSIRVFFYQSHYCTGTKLFVVSSRFKIGIE